LLREALSLAPDNADIMFRAVLVYETDLSQRDQALYWLKKAVEKGYSWKEIDNASPLRSMRDDPRFRQLRQNSQKNN